MHPQRRRSAQYILFWDYPQLDLVFCDEPIKDAHHKGKTFAGWVSPQLINTPTTALIIRLTGEMGMKQI
jgi:hypothetical protein